jgi:wee1-like protein kinase
LASPPTLRIGGSSTTVDDGDSRYMSPEILNDDYSDLKKVDILPLGCTILYSGEEWQNIRAGNIGTFDAGRDLHKIILSMIAPTPEQRPGAATLRICSTWPASSGSPSWGWG